VRIGKRRIARSKPDWSFAIMNNIVEEGEDSCGCVNMIPEKQKTLANPAKTRFVLAVY
jgi:hypothetical protein